ncbi:glutamine synthetase family protein [Paracoccus versutus]|uniref:Glutamine synthetase n=1 Tax=Paracoccus versutus TaxID=34007 RepID=A0A3D9Y2L7_PARVE|nr:glutamine synthetase [Paracoccus versutus]REF73429.1 glutamine synthetase [Paracoccus versutus]WGR54554.1 glutamine synthetase [Paracoccus versutus]
MQPENVRTLEDAAQIVRDSGAEHIKIGIADLDGIMRGKYLSTPKFLSALENGFNFADVLFGWDMTDTLNPESKFTGWHTGYPDAEARIIPETCRMLPDEDGRLFFLSEFTGKATTLCPRSLLKRVVERADRLGFKACVASEFEFFVFNETPHSVRTKHYRNMENLAPGSFSYSMLRASVHSDTYEAVLSMCRQLNIPIEGLHEETGPGVMEAALTYSDPLTAADNAFLFKTFAKIQMQRLGKMATFMAKWSNDWPGQSGHLHLSLQTKDGKPVFHDSERPETASQEMLWFIGGQQTLMPEVLPMVAPTVNSFTRLVPGMWAPTQATWGFENRTCALRAIKGSPKSQRVEYRIAGADINPYVAIAAALASGLWGIENRIEPDAPIAGNSYDKEHAPERVLPARLLDAANRLEGSVAARDLFGDQFVEHYAMTRRWEEREAQKAVTDWQLERYFELI